MLFKHSRLFNIYGQEVLSPEPSVSSGDDTGSGISRAKMTVGRL